MSATSEISKEIIEFLLRRNLPLIFQTMSTTQRSLAWAEVAP